MRGLDEDTNHDDLDISLNILIIGKSPPRDCDNHVLW